MLEVKREASNESEYLPSGFDWQLDGRLMVVDGNAILPQRPYFDNLMGLNCFSTLCFDPSNALSERQDELSLLDEFQLVNGRVLGDGNATLLFACLDNHWSGTLPPLAPQFLPPSKKDKAEILAKLALQSTRLDDIDGLPPIDWLLLDERHDVLSVLKNGVKQLMQTLAIEVRVAVEPTHDGQTDLGHLVAWMRAHGFRPYRFADVRNRTHLSEEEIFERWQFTQLTFVDFLFIPDEERLSGFSIDRKTKLAFLLDAIYGVHDVTAGIISTFDERKAKVYLISRGYVNQFTDDPDTFVLTSSYCPTPWETLDREKIGSDHV